MEKYGEIPKRNSRNKELETNNEIIADTDEVDLKLAPHKEGHANVGDTLKSAVYGGLDGMITTYSVVMAAFGANLAPVIVLAMGIANLIGDGLSMALGDYLSTLAADEFN